MDESCLDFSYWGRAQDYVYKKKPQTISELKKIVEEFNASLTEKDIRAMLQNMVKRAHLCLQENGGAFWTAFEKVKKGQKQQ